MRAASAYALTTLENERLAGRAPDVAGRAAADRERGSSPRPTGAPRIERDLHDGAQQRLVALRIKLELVAERWRDSRGSGADISDLEDDVERRSTRCGRSRARDLPPAPGRARAGRGAPGGRRGSPIHTTVVARNRRPPRSGSSRPSTSRASRPSERVKHATRPRQHLAVETTGLRFEVHDDGAGFDVPSHGRPA